MTCVASAMGCNRGAGPQQAPETGVTTVVVSDRVIHSGLKRLGMNISGQNYYDSGQILRNLIFINPGFEGESWQSILRCKTVSATSCTDGNPWTQWPNGFLDGATFEVISGPAAGTTGTVQSSSAASETEPSHGFTINFAPLRATPAMNDFLLVKKMMPGNAQAGWWTDASGGASFATEFKDLAPNTQGKQALKVLARGTGQSANVSSYFDSMAGHSFVQLRGLYRLTFRAKSFGGNNQLHVDLHRQADGEAAFISKMVPLTDKWRDYGMDFVAAENGQSIGSVVLSFGVSGSDVLLDDVSLTPVAAAHGNTTVFRDEVVETLRELHPGILRYNDGNHLGSSIDNMIAPPFARVRAGYNEGNHQQDSVPLGLQEFLQLCEVVGAEPWINLPAGTSPSEARSLIEYLAGPAGSKYGAKRSARGRTEPWTNAFAQIHLELGNEEWNGVTFPGSAMPDPVAYGRRAKEVFSGARDSPYYQSAKFDLVMGTFVLLPDWTRKELANSGRYDSTAIAPYLFDALDDASSTEAIFGPMLAQPEMIDSLPTGYVYEQARTAQSASQPARLSVYEVNLGTSSGIASQAVVDKTVASMGAGLALIDHMLLMMRDLGVTTQSIWSLSGYGNVFNNTRDSVKESTPLFGTVIDMGGTTNLKRPQFLAEQLANEAILPTMLQTEITGPNPTWNQDLSYNNKVQLEKAHLLQTFAFADGNKRSLILLNLSRMMPLPVAFAGNAAPNGMVQMTRLTAANITDTNELQRNVMISPAAELTVNHGGTYELPPFSMTVLTWTVKP